MDWLRSEDLKEEKDVTAPILIITGQRRLHFSFLSANRCRFLEMHYMVSVFQPLVA